MVQMQEVVSSSFYLQMPQVGQRESASIGEGESLSQCLTWRHLCIGSVFTAGRVDADTKEKKTRGAVVLVE